MALTLQERKAELEAQREKTIANVHALNGAIELLNVLINEQKEIEIPKENAE